ncbi:MAG: glycosyltransferase family 2 protein [Prevotella sp.]|nr:glycosyltransferase family 2 protein [Prevotella sp.]
MRIEVFTFCWNEMTVLPFAVDYWRRYADHVTVFDNGSTDGSIEFMQQHADLITIEHWDTNNQINDRMLLDAKNEAWKRARGSADLVVMADMDEMLIPMGDELQRMLDEGCTVCMPRWFTMMSDEVPHHEDGKLLHEIRPFAYQAPAKAIVFDPNRIENMRYEPGAHQCQPEGYVKWFDGGIYCLHTDHNFSLENKIERYRQMNARQSAINRQKGWGIHYGFSEEHLRKWWGEAWQQTVNFNEILQQHNG